MASKNYGMLNYTRNYNSPRAKDSAKYLADIFEMNDTQRVEKIFAEELKRSRPIRQYTDYDIQRAHRAIRGIFIEKQLLKHGRERLTSSAVIDKYNSSSIRGIAKEYISLRKSTDRSQFENEHGQFASDFERALPSTAQQDQPETKSRQSKAATKKQVADIAKRAANGGQRPLSKDLQDNLKKQDTKSAYKFMEEAKTAGRSEKAYSQTHYAERSAAYSQELPKIKQDITGNYVNIPLHKQLKKILDDVIGQAEIRAQERGFNRPSRFGHFVKNCFLPVYRCNKPRKRPAFYIDASSSMTYHSEPEELTGGFSCKTSAITAFLRANHRRISELRPVYYAFASLSQAMKFDILKETPHASGGTNIEFLANVNEKDNTVIITDAEFMPREYAVARMWATAHPNAVVHWIVNNTQCYSRLKEALSGMKSQKVYYIPF